MPDVSDDSMRYAGRRYVQSYLESRNAWRMLVDRIIRHHWPWLPGRLIARVFLSIYGPISEKMLACE